MQWVPYFEEHQVMLEEAFAAGWATTTIFVKARPPRYPDVSYEIEFGPMRQKNNATGRCRAIRRTAGSKAPGAKRVVSKRVVSKHSSDETPGTVPFRPHDRASRIWHKAQLHLGRIQPEP